MWPGFVSSVWPQPNCFGCFKGIWVGKNKPCCRKKMFVLFFFLPWGQILLNQTKSPHYCAPEWYAALYLFLLRFFWTTSLLEPVVYFVIREVVSSFFLFFFCLFSFLMLCIDWFYVWLCLQSLVLLSVQTSNPSLWKKVDRMQLHTPWSTHTC